jgi:hypothetical protein
MPDDLSILKVPVFLDAVNELERLLTQSSRAFLVGAGCSKGAGLPLMGELTDLVASSPQLKLGTADLIKGVRSEFVDAISPTIEDYLSEMVDHLAIAERREGKRATNDMVLIDSKPYSAPQLRLAIEDIKSVIGEILKSTPKTLETHRAFVKSVHRTMKTGKGSSPLSVDYFVLNYDTLFEDALAIERVSYTDGFSGGAVGWWEPSAFETSKTESRLLKLHGSVDWCLIHGEDSPRRIRGSIGLPSGSLDQLMIWPASTKYRETQLDPFAQMAQVFRESLRPPEGFQKVLTVVGYSFGDRHINVEIDHALREVGSQLTLIAFTGEDHPNGQLATWLKDGQIADQIRVHSRRGFYHGSKSGLSAADLPWWKFENITRLLAGER